MLGFHAFTAKSQIQSLVGELRSCKGHSQKKKKKERKEFSLFNFSFSACYMYLKMRHEHTVPGAFLLF